MKIETIIVGCGQIARQTYIPKILKSSQFKLAGIVDPDDRTTKFILHLFGLQIPAYSSIEQVSECEAAIVCVPPHLHANVCIELLEKGIHVLCEKPMATRFNDAQEMIEVAKKKRKTLLVGMTKHYCENTALLRDVINAGYLGDVVSYELLSGTRSQWNAANPKRYDPEYVPGGATFENGVHWIYRLLYWFGPATAVEYRDDRIDGVEANATIDCIHTSAEPAIKGKMIFSADHVLPNKLIIKGTKRVAMMTEKDEGGLYIIEKINNKDVWLRLQRDIDEVRIDPFDRELHDFYRSIRDGREPEIPADLAASVIEFLESAYELRKQLDQSWFNFKAL